MYFLQAAKMDDQNFPMWHPISCEQEKCVQWSASQKFWEGKELQFSLLPVGFLQDWQRYCFQSHFLGWRIISPSCWFNLKDFHAFCEGEWFTFLWQTKNGYSKVSATKSKDLFITFCNTVSRHVVIGKVLPTVYPVKGKCFHGIFNKHGNRVHVTAYIVE